MKTLLSEETLFLEKIAWVGADYEDCWEWDGAKSIWGYGKMSLRRDGRKLTVAVHRYSYELFIEPIPESLFIDHLCRNVACVNPEHLIPVTNQENQLVGKAARKTHCKHGHKYTEENTDWSTGRRSCHECRRIRQLRRWKRARTQKAHS